MSESPSVAMCAAAFKFRAARAESRPSRLTLGLKVTIQRFIPACGAGSRFASAGEATNTASSSLDMSLMCFFSWSARSGLRAESRFLRGE